MKYIILLKIVSVCCLTALGITYFIYVKQDSTVLLSLSSIIGAMAGYAIGRRRRAGGE